MQSELGLHLSGHGSIYPMGEVKWELSCLRKEIILSL